MRFIYCMFLSVCIWALTAGAMAQDRIALVVGNAGYEKASVLDNTVNDAADVAGVLGSLGFEVMLHQDIRTRGAFREVVRTWREALARGENSVGLFFYAGHAVQVHGENYLIPTAADLRDIPDLDVETLPLGYVTAMAGDARNPVNLFFIDACRDNPFRGFSRSLNRGLAVTDTPEGSIIVYAASPGKVASDGAGRNSPFTANLLQEITTGEHVLLMLQNVVKGVRQDTRGQQQPWFHASLSGDFYFNRQSPGQPPVQSGSATGNASGEVSGEPGTVAANHQDVQQEEAQTTGDAVSADIGSREGRARPPTPGQSADPAAKETAAGTGLASLAPAEKTARAELSGTWSGDFRTDGGRGAAATLRFVPTADGGYDVGFSRLINYGALPASCSIATGRMMPLGPDGLRLVLTHSGCRGSGMVRLQNGRIVGKVEIDGRSLQLDLGPAGSG